MRISTNTFYEQSLAALTDRYATLARIQQHIARARAYTQPSENPTAASQEVNLDQAIGLIEQYQANITRGKTASSLEDNVLAGVERVLKDVRQAVIGAGASPMDSQTLQVLGNTVRALYQQLLALANTRDAQGQYLFAGFKSDTLPFIQTSGPGIYAGDSGQRRIAIAPQRAVEISDPGDAVFEPGIPGQDMFKTLDDIATQFATGSVTSAQLSAFMGELEAEMGNVRDLRARISSRQQELASTGELHTQSLLFYRTQLSKLRDLHYPRAITELQQTQTALEAAQKAYTAVQKLSLFNFIG